MLFFKSWITNHESIQKYTVWSQMCHINVNTIRVEKKSTRNSISYQSFYQLSFSHDNNKFGLKFSEKHWRSTIAHEIGQDSYNRLKLCMEVGFGEQLRKPFFFLAMWPTRLPSFSELEKTFLKKSMFCMFIKKIVGRYSSVN